MCFELRKENRHKQYLKYTQYHVNDRKDLNQFKYSSKLIIDKTKNLRNESLLCKYLRV